MRFSVPSEEGRGPSCSGPQICINIHPDAVPPIHTKSYHVATDKVPAQNGDKFRTQADSGGHIRSSVVRTRCSAGPVLPLCSGLHMRSY